MTMRGMRPLGCCLFKCTSVNETASRARGLEAQQSCLFCDRTDDSVRSNVSAWHLLGGTGSYPPLLIPTAAPRNSPNRRTLIRLPHPLLMRLLLPVRRGREGEHGQCSGHANERQEEKRARAQEGLGRRQVSGLRDVKVQAARLPVLHGGALDWKHRDWVSW